MGLAPYGKPKYVRSILENLIDIKANWKGGVKLSIFLQISI